MADPLVTIDQNSNITVRFLNGPSPAGVDAIMAQEGIQTPGQAGTDHWVLADNLNTPRDIITDASAVVDHVITNGFGQVAYESNPSIAHWAGFAGGHVDAFTGLVNDYHRWYDPADGRWESQDPLDFTAGDSNLSRYGGNNPTDNRDPTGLSFWSTYTYYLTNPSRMDPSLQFAQNVAVGAVAGAATTAAIVVAAPVVATAGAASLMMASGGSMLPATATAIATSTVTTGLFVAGTSGIYVGGISTYQAYQSGNYNQVGFNLGTFAGGLAVGVGGGGRYMSNALSPHPTQSPNTWNPFAIMAYDWGLRYRPRLGPPWNPVYMTSGPTPASGGLTAATSSGNYVQRMYEIWLKMMIEHGAL